jgi:2-oxoglutarate ferredoxin oxidoreductase subunit alpha
MESELVSGNEALGYGAIIAGCRYYFGYPITPQNEVPEFMSREMPKAGGVFVQAESEVAAINMIYGAACAGKRALITSSSTGISLMQEGISALAAAHLPCVVVNVMRDGPGGGGIGPSQLDYFQATKGGGHGGYLNMVLAPSTVQEIFDLMQESFYLADKYRLVVMMLTDAVLGQMLEPIVMERIPEGELPENDWATTGHKNQRAPRMIPILLKGNAPRNYFQEYQDEMNELRRRLHEEEERWEETSTEDAEYLLVAYGSTARIARSAVEQARGEGLKVGMMRPITLLPFPYGRTGELVAGAKKTLVLEASGGQMIEDVRLSAEGRGDISFHGKVGAVFSPQDIYNEIVKLTS